LTTSPSIQFPTSIHPSGRWIAVQQGVPPEAMQVVFVPIRSENGRVTVTGEKPLVLVGGDFRLVQPAFSPDGHWVAFLSNESGGYSVYVRPFPALDYQVQVSTERAADPRWSRTSNDLLFTRVPDFRSGRPAQWPAGAVAGSWPPAIAW
jgi:serine/threonine-protein kinase